jgi:ketosteroid isomerase-like protein
MSVSHGTSTHHELYHRFEHARVTGDARAQADMFAPDGVFEAPLSPGDPFPRRTEGREAIYQMLTRYHARSAGDVQIRLDRSRRLIHATADPQLFVVEIDLRMQMADKEWDKSVVHFYRVHDGQIVLLRDYFLPEQDKHR